MTKTVIDIVDEILYNGTNSITEEGIADVEEWLLQQEQATEEELLVTAELVDDNYIRSAIMPPNLLAVGSASTKPCVVVVKRGKLTVWTLDGKKTIEGPAVILAKAGMRRVGYTETEVEWVNIFNVEDLEKTGLEQQLFVQSSELLHKLGV